MHKVKQSVKRGVGRPDYGIGTMWPPEGKDAGEKDVLSWPPVVVVLNRQSTCSG